MVAFDYQVAFFNDPSRKPEPLDVAYRADSALWMRIPYRLRKFAKVGITCWSVGPDGKLGSCELRELAPENAGYEQAGEALLSGLFISPSQAQAILPGLKFISIQARLSNSDAPAVDGPCWPPQCSIMVAPVPGP